MNARDGKPRILVMGCGGIGGIVTTYLSEVGADITAVTTNERIATATAAVLTAAQRT